MTLGQFFQLLSLVMLVVILGLGNQMVTSIALHIILIVFLYGFGGGGSSAPKLQREQG